MRCLGPLCGLVIGPLALTAGAGLFAGTLACLALCARDGAAASKNGRAAPGDQGAPGRENGPAGAPDAAARARRRRAL